MYKIAISDLDGTLLGPDHKVSAQTRNSIHNWIKSGRKFVIATGRHHIEAKTLQDELGEPIYLISSNGARVHNKAGELIMKQNLPSEIATEIINMPIPKEVQINMFTDENWYSNFLLPQHSGMGLNKHFNCQVTDIKSLDQSNTIKLFFCAEAKVLRLVHKQLATRFGSSINLTFSLDICLEVMAANTNKGSAVEIVLKDKAIHFEDAIAFGDGMNDVEMLTVVGKPILMGNAQLDLRKALPEAELTLSAKEHGVAVKIDQLLA